MVNHNKYNKISKKKQIKVSQKYLKHLNKRISKYKML